MSAGAYDKAFYDYNTVVATQSAHVIIPILQSLLPPIHSVVDFGCARGAWLSVWKEFGIETACGVDGDYVDRERLLIEPNFFHAADLAQPIDLERRFDLVQSLEVAEHIPAASASMFLETLTRHSDIVFFSAAAPGQGGEHHINEQPYEYWKSLFAEHGYDMFDCVRPLLAGHGKTIQPWYLYNTFVYAHRNHVPNLPNTVRATRILEGQEVPDVSPIAYRLRKFIVRSLPRSSQDALARLTAKRYSARQ